MVSYKYSMERLRIFQSRLNPCCSGRWSRTKAIDSVPVRYTVLILVVVEDGLVPHDTSDVT